MLDTSARLLTLLSLLQMRLDWTGPELAERLGVSERTLVFGELAGEIGGVPAALPVLGGQAFQRRRGKVGLPVLDQVVLARFSRRRYKCQPTKS